MLDQETFLSSNLTVENAIDTITEIEKSGELLANNRCVKNLKSYKHQAVIESDSYFYKVYEDKLHGLGPFNSHIRNALAQVYNELGIYWNVISFERKDKIYDFEQRQKLNVAKPGDVSFGKILLSFSKLLDKVQFLLEFGSILEQIQAHKPFTKVAKLQLARQCINKFQDYAFFNGQAILLDDAEWYIALLDCNGKRLIIPPKFEVHVSTSYGQFNFSAYSIVKTINSKEEKLVNCNDNFSHGWYLTSYNRHHAPKNNETTSNQTDIQTSNPKRNNFTVVSSASKQIEKSFATFERKKEGEYKHFPVVTRKTLMQKKDYYTEDDILYNIGNMRIPWQWTFKKTHTAYTEKLNQSKIGNSQYETEVLFNELVNLSKRLRDFDSSKFNNVSLLNGEFFQGQLNSSQVKNAFFDVVDKLCELYTNKKVGSIWLCAALTEGTQQHLYKMLETFRQAGVQPNPHYFNSGVWLLTNWHPSNELLSKKEQESWEFHMQNIAAYYPWVKRNTTIALTEDFCNMYLEGSFLPHHFMGKYQTSLCYNQPSCNSAISKNKNSFPKRTTFRKFLLKYARHDADTFDGLMNTKFMANNQQKLQNVETAIRSKTTPYCSTKCEFLNSMNNTSSTKETIKTPCQTHGLCYCAYNDSNACMLCDKDKIWNAVWQK